MGRKNTMELILAQFIVDPETSCWIWTRSKVKGGYGKVSFEGKRHLTHRLTYEHFKGPIPQGLEPDHLCRNRACGNPDHLEPVTHRVNSLRGVGPSAKCAVQTHCKHGHPF